MYTSIEEANKDQKNPRYTVVKDQKTGKVIKDPKTGKPLKAKIK